MIKKASYSFLFFISTATLFGQQIMIEGKVFSSYDSSTISNAHIYFTNLSHIGTVTNDNGWFRLNFPDSLRDFEITISHVRYKSDRRIDKENTIFYMKPGEVILNPLEIVNNDSSWSILRKSYDHFTTNYPQKPHLLEAYYREVHTEDSSLSFLLESVINIQDFGRRGNQKKQRIQVLQFRKTDDSRNLDIRMVFFKAIMARTLGGLNNFHKTYEKNPLLNIHNPDHFFSSKKMESVPLELKEIIYAEDTLAVIESLLVESLRSRIITMTINLEDYAIVEIIERSTILKADEIFKTHVIFQEIGNVYYPLFIDYEYPNLLSESEFKTSHQSVYISEVISDKKKFRRIRKKFSESTTQDIYKKEYVQNTSFWDVYNRPIHRLLQKQLENYEE